MQRHTVGLFALSLATAALGDPPVPPTARADESQTVDELRTLVRDLKDEVDALKARDDDNWLTRKRSEEIRALVHDVLADADTRASLLQSGAMAGYDKGFFISSADGNNLLKLSGQMQVRFAYSSTDDGDTSQDSDRWGFENRRTKLTFAGHVVDPSWKYEVTGAFDRSGGPGGGGTFGLEVAEIKKDLGDGWAIRFGQFKAPFLREELVSSKRQLAVERSLVNEEFNQDYSQGIELSYAADAWRMAVMYGDGFAPGGAGSRNTSFLVADTEYAFTGRAEFLFAGSDWKQFDDFTSWRGEEFGALVGVAAHYQKGEFGTVAGPDATTAETEFLGLTGDVSLEFGGANLYAAVVYRNLDTEATGVELDQWGFVVQGGVFLNEDWEAFARYEFGDEDAAGAGDLSVVTVGVNRYWARHALKWTTDVGFALDAVESIWSTSGAGHRTDGADEDGQLVIRSQFQLLF